MKIHSKIMNQFFVGRNFFTSFIANPISPVGKLFKNVSKSIELLPSSTKFIFEKVVFAPKNNLI